MRNFSIRWPNAKTVEIEMRAISSSSGRKPILDLNDQCRILLVDGETDIVQVIKRGLEAKGYQVYEFDFLQKAIRPMITPPMTGRKTGLLLSRLKAMCKIPKISLYIIPMKPAMRPTKRANHRSTRRGES